MSRLIGREVKKQSMDLLSRKKNKQSDVSIFSVNKPLKNFSIAYFFINYHKNTSSFFNRLPRDFINYYFKILFKVVFSFITSSSIYLALGSRGTAFAPSPKSGCRLNHEKPEIISNYKVKTLKIPTKKRRSCFLVHSLFSVLQIYNLFFTI